ncbi:hypothetical protein [Thalassobaculum sp.]|uniref:hypothetical protein n=1 Tax=Thalassobaculum sp. TaxID=2022740 RepID=UPI0032EDE7E1
MAETRQAQLDRVNAAIAAIEDGTMQSFTFAGRAVTHINLDVLYRERARLEPLAEREARGGGMRVRSGVVYRG